jgi:hypothetical protein
MLLSEFLFDLAEFLIGFQTEKRQNYAEGCPEYICQDSGTCDAGKCRGTPFGL